jgi:cytoskeletal protein RodZ
MPTGFILLVAAVLAAIAYGSWSYMTLNGRDTGDIVAQLPKQIADIVGLEAGTPEIPAQQSEAVIPAEPTVETVENSGDLPATQSAAETPAPVESQPTPTPDDAPAVVVQANEDPLETTVEVVSSAQANPQVSQALQETTPTPSETVSEVEAVREAVEVVRGAPRLNPQINAAGEGPTARFEPVRILTVPPSEGSGPVQVAGVPDATQTAVLPSSPPDFVVTEQVSRVVLRATEISWVELRDASGKRVFSRLLKRGETYNVPGKSGITLATGNAGALDVLVDGQTIGPLGPAGAVRRNVLLEPDALLQRLNARQ